MINEGIIASDTKTVIKSEMLKQLWALGPTNPDTWERAVFKSCVGLRREDVDWAFEDNQAGYYTWIKSFDELIGELVNDGYVRVEALRDGSQAKRLVPTETDGPIDYSELMYPH